MADGSGFGCELFLVRNYFFQDWLGRGPGGCARGEGVCCIVLSRRQYLRGNALRGKIPLVFWCLVWVLQIVEGDLARLWVWGTDITILFVCICIYIPLIIVSGHTVYAPVLVLAFCIGPDICIYILINYMHWPISTYDCQSI